MKKVVIAAVALLLLGGGGAGAYFYFSKPAEASAGHAAAEADKAAEEAKKESAKGEHGEGGHVEYVQLDPLILPIVDSTGVTQVVSLVVAIEVADASGKTKVENMIPRLKDAYIQDMYGVLNKHGALKGGVIQVGIIKERLNGITAKILGPDTTTGGVLLQVVQQRPV